MIGAELPSPADDAGTAALAALRTIELTVSWLEGEDHELDVRRTTCFFDQTQWGESFPDLEETGGLPGELADTLPQGATQ